MNSVKQKVLIFGSASDIDADTAHAKTLIMLQNNDLDDYTHAGYRDVVFELDTSNINAYIVKGTEKLVLDTFDTIFLRSIKDESIRAAIAHYCALRGIRVVNSENMSLPLASKLSQYIHAAQMGIPIPRTFFCSQNTLIPLAKQFLDTDTYVVKSISGSNGNDNYKTDTLPSQLESLCVIQSFVPNTYEYRVITIDGKVALAYKKVNQGISYQNNIARGGRRETITTLPDEVAEYALAMAAACNREIAGTDIVYSDTLKQHIFFEVNYSYGHPSSDIGKVDFDKYTQSLADFLHK